MKTIERHYMMATDEALKEALEVIILSLRKSGMFTRVHVNFILNV